MHHNAFNRLIALFTNLIFKQLCPFPRPIYLFCQDYFHFFFFNFTSGFPISTARMP